MTIDAKESNVENRITATRAQEMLFECLKDELNELDDYHRSAGNIYLAWFTLHWTVNLGVLAACLSHYDRVQPLLQELAGVFVFLNVLSVGACFSVLSFVNGSQRRATEIVAYLNNSITRAIASNPPEASSIQIRCAYPHVLGVRIMWLTQSTIWVLIVLWVLVLLKFPR